MAAGEFPVAREAELASLPGPKLVDHLCTTHRRADYEAVARVLDSRDRRLEAALAENEDLRRKCDALLGAHPLPREVAEEKPRHGIAAPAPVRRDEQGVEGSDEGEVKGAQYIDLCDEDEEEKVEAGHGAGSRVPIREACEDAEADEDDTVPLSQLWKRRRRGEPGAVKSGKADGKGQHNSVDSGGNDPRKCTSVRTDVPDALTGQMVSRSEDSMVAAFVQGKGTVQPEKGRREMPRAVLHSRGEVVWSTLQKRKFGKKDGSSAVPGDTTSSQPRSASLGPKKEGSSAVPGVTTSSQARDTSLTPKKCRESTSPDDEMCNALSVSALVGAGSTLLVGLREKEKGIGGVQRAKVLQGASGIRERGGKLDSTPTKVGESNKREGELHKKSTNAKLNQVLKRQDKVDASGPSAPKNLEKGNNAVRSAPGGSSRADSKNGVSARGVSQPPKGSEQMNKMSTELSSKHGNEKVGADMYECSPLLRQSEEGNVAREVVSFEEMRMATVHPLSIRSLLGPDLQILTKGGGELSKKLMIEGSPKYGEKNNDAGSGKSSSPSRQSEGVKFIGEGPSKVEPRVGRLSPSILSNYSTGEQIHSVSKNAALCSPTTTKALFEYGSSCTPVKHAIFPPSSSKSTSIQARERNLLHVATTRRWESDEHMTASLKGNMELSMQAFCALYRGRKLIIRSSEGEQTGTIGLTKIDAIRAMKLAEFLLDGKLQGPLKRTAEELVRYDAAGPTFLEKVVQSCSKELFDIYKNKEDPYFC